MAWKSLIQLSLLATTAISTPAPRAPSVVSTATCNGASYVYESLAGYGYTPSNARDRFGDTAGGIGSSAAIDPKSWRKNGNTYTGILWALPDRGWNTEGTLNYQPRVHKFSITFTPDASASASSPSPPNLHLQYLDSIRFSDPAGTPLTGLDPNFLPPYLSFPTTGQVPSAIYTGDGFGGNGTGGNRVSGDTEGLVLSPDGSFWVSDEYGAYIYHFSPTGSMLSAIAPPDAVIPRRNNSVSFNANSPPRYDPNRAISPKSPKTGRSNNQGLEGLTASPDGKKLYALLQSAARQEGGNADASNGRRYTRFFQYDISNPSAAPVYEAEYVVPLPLYANASNVAAQSEVKYISPTQFLILSRDSGAGRGQGPDNTQSVYRHADVFDIGAATNIKGPTYDCANCSIASSQGVLKPAITPATYCSFLDFNVNAELNKFGVHNGGADDAGLLNEKWESLALVPVEPGWGDWGSGSDEWFLFSLSDNDFITQDGYLKGGEFQYADESGYDLLNQVLVFKIQLPRGSRPRVG